MKKFIWKGRIIDFGIDFLEDRSIDYKKPTFVFNELQSFLKANLFRVVSVSDGFVRCRVLEEEKEE